MTSKKIEDLPPNDPLSGLEFVHAVQNGNSRRVPLALLLGGSGDGGTGAVTGLVSGGAVTWEAGYTFRVSGAVYLINGIAYQSLEQTVTLDAPDGVNDRIDIIALNTDGNVVAIKGTAVALPFEPDVDPSTQLALTSVDVVHATTQPPATTPGNVAIYKENVEWTGFVNNARWNLAATSHPKAGTKHIKGTALLTGDWVSLVAPGVITPSAYSSLRLFLESFAARWGTGRITAQWQDANNRLLGRAVTIRDGAYGLRTSLLGNYQQVVIPMSAFVLPGSAAPIKLFCRWAGGSQTINIDDIELLPSGVGSGGGGSTGGGLDQAAADARYLQRAQNLFDLGSPLAARNNLDLRDPIIVPCSDETTAITVGPNKRKFRMPYAGTLLDVRASCNLAPTGSAIIIDVNEGGVSLLSTKCSIAAGSTTSEGGTAEVISDANVNDNAEVSIDFDQVGSTIAGVGVKVTLIFRRAS